MALKIKSDAKTVFFKALFGEGHPHVKQVENLLNAGVDFTVNLYNIVATYNGESAEVALTQSSNNIMKKQVDNLLLMQNATAVAKFIDYMKDKVVAHKGLAPMAPSPNDPTYAVYLNGVSPNGFINTIKVIRAALGNSLSESKEMVDKAKSGSSVLIKTGLTLSEAQELKTSFEAIGALSYVLNAAGTKLAPEAKSNMDAFVQAVKANSLSMPGVSKAEPVPSIIPLRDAKALGQKVRGTSAGSIYRCIAYNSRVKVAVRLPGGDQISFRVEWQNPTSTELENLKQAGLNLKSEYASLHLNAEGVPQGRVIGAMLLGMGIDFDELITNPNKLVKG
jgi:ribosomal protein L7/L12